MSKRFVGIGLTAFVLGSAMVVFQGLPRAEAAPTTRAARLTKPWNELKDLTPEQIDKIKAIHEQTLIETHQLEAKEKAAILEVLTDAQKKEIDEIIVTDKKEAAERAAERKHATTAPTTKPAAK